MEQQQEENGKKKKYILIKCFESHRSALLSWSAETQTDTIKSLW